MCIYSCRFPRKHGTDFDDSVTSIWGRKRPCGGTEWRATTSGPKGIEVWRTNQVYWQSFQEKFVALKLSSQSLVAFVGMD